MTNLFEQDDAAGRAGLEAPSVVDPGAWPSSALGATSLQAVLRQELEDVLQSIYAARQDVLALVDSDDPTATRHSAERTLNGCAATVQLLLRLLRVASADQLPDHPFVRMVAGPFGVLGREHEVLYFNTALRELIGLQHRTIALSRFAERRWIDRGEMAAHLALATIAGRATMRTVLTRSDGREILVEVETFRIDEYREPLLLVGLRPVPAAPPATA